MFDLICYMVLITGLIVLCVLTFPDKANYRQSEEQKRAKIALILVIILVVFALIF